MRLRSSHAALGLVAVCAGCNLSRLIESIATHSQLGVISGVAVPDTVSRGVPFQVTVSTSGGTCFKGADRTNVSYVTADTALIEPYDNVIASPCGGGDRLLIVPHVASVTFTRQGSAVVRVAGSRDATGLTTVIVEHAVQVR